MRAHRCRWLLLLGCLGGLTSCAPDVVLRKDVEIPKGLEEIDFADDGDGSLAAMHGRQGKWGTYRDSCPGGIVEPPVGTPLSPEKDGVNGSPSYYRSTAEGFDSRMLDVPNADIECWGGYIYFDFNYDGATSPHDYDATAYTGIFFAAKGWTSNNNLIGVKLVQASLTSTKNGGGCDPAINVCEDHYSNDFTLEPEWRGYKLRFSELAQDGWGLQGPFNPAQLRSMQFVGNTENAMGISFDYDISIDHVGFIKSDP
jgi:hypothetical protein